MAFFKQPELTPEEEKINNDNFRTCLFGCFGIPLLFLLITLVAMFFSGDLKKSSPPVAVNVPDQYSAAAFLKIRIENAYAPRKVKFPIDFHRYMEDRSAQKFGCQSHFDTVNNFNVPIRIYFTAEFRYVGPDKYDFEVISYSEK